MDEASKQLIRETRLIIPARPGQLETFDHEYAREGVCNLFMFCEPLAGRRHVRVTTRRTRLDWAHAVKEMVDVWYPDAELIRLVMDNLNTHSLASLYEAFDPEEAQRIRKRLEIHHTPKHGSWLNVAEIELSVLGRQCLDRRIADAATLTREVAAWEAARNAAKLRVDWQFTTADARIKLHRLYPVLRP
jgi:DDE superfamily endonuclease